MRTTLVIFCTCPDDSTARALAAELVDRRLAACVNVLPQIRSIYRWQGAVHDDGESLLVIKTTQAVYPALQSWLAQAHPYEVPEIIALPVEKGLPAYLEWVVEQTLGPAEKRNENKDEDR